MLGRWIGKEISFVLMNEFGGGHSNDYWQTAFQSGHIKVNGNKVNQSYILRDSDLLTHLTHRHEPPVIGNIEYVGENSQVLAVSKPSSMPIHPCGSYRLNSLTQILSVEHIIPNQPKLHLVHRLDRVTSGLVILAKSVEDARSISKEIRDKVTSKVKTI